MTTAPGVDVTIIIVSYNTRDDVCECISSALEATHEVSLQVIVVDNASADGTSEKVRADFPDVKLIANPDNRGFAAANNQGLAIASGRYVLLLNPDTVVLPGAIDRSVEWADARSDVAVVGCQILERPGEVQRTCFRFPSPYDVFVTTTGLTSAFPRSRIFSGHNLPDWDRSTERDVDVVSGMFMLVRGEAIEAVGVMDEAYFVYGEETDWCFRFRRAGWRCVFTPVGQVIHKEGGGRSTVQRRVQMFVQLQKSILIFMRKQKGVLAWAIAKALYTTSMVSRWLLWSGAMIFSRREDLAVRRAEAGAALRFHLTGAMPKGV